MKITDISKLLDCIKIDKPLTNLMKKSVAWHILDGNPSQNFSPLLQSFVKEINPAIFCKNLTGY